MVMGPIVEYPCDFRVGTAMAVGVGSEVGTLITECVSAGIGTVMTVGVGAEVRTDAGATTGSDREVGVAELLQPTNAKIVRIPSKSEATRRESVSEPVDFSNLI